MNLFKICNSFAMLFYEFIGFGHVQFKHISFVMFQNVPKILGCNIWLGYTKNLAN